MQSSMTCGSKKHIEEALAKIRVKDIDEENQKESKPNPNLKRERDRRMLQEAQ